MEIIRTEGCVVSGTTIDGINIDDISNDTRKEISDWLYKQLIESPELFNCLVNDLLDTLGESEYLYTCEQCGDDVIETKLVI